MRDRERSERGERGDRDREPKNEFVRKKGCRFCIDKELRIDYKDGKALKPYVSERGKMIPGRMTGLCCFHQRELTSHLKRARILALLPFTATRHSMS